MTMRYAHLATHDLDGCVVVLETPPAPREPLAASCPDASSPAPQKARASSKRASAAAKEAGEPAKAKATTGKKGRAAP